VFSYFHTKGSQIIDRNGRPIRISGVNWYGFEGEAHIPQGLWIRSYQSLLDQIKTVGFTAIRLPYSTQMLQPTSVTDGINFFLNPDLQGLTPLECMDKVIEYCGQIGLRVILDRHSLRSNNFQNEGLWYFPTDPFNYGEQVFIDEWVMLAKRYANTAVMGADLWNEPKGQATWGVGDAATDWNEAAERVGNAILAANPDWLIIVEGVGNNSWWGGNLQGVAANPVNLIVPNKVVYSVHEYCQDVFNHTWLIDETFPNNLRGVWNDNFGYIVKQDIAPVYVGEYGTAFRYPGDYTWLRHWVAYINGEYSEDGVNDLKDGEQGLSWTFWAINPGGDVGGVLEDDWITVNEAKMAFIRSALAPLLPTYDPIPTTQPTLLQSILTPSSLSPIVAPTQPVFSYFHTKGSQIIDRNGRPIRISGVNWYGFEGEAHIPQGLWIRSYQSLLDQIKTVGFTAIRLPYSTQMLQPTSVTDGINFFLNPDLQGLTPLECMDKVIEYCGQIGLRVILDRHSLRSNNFQNEGLWYFPTDPFNYGEQVFIDEWVMLAKRYANTAVMGADLWNEPKGQATWGVGDAATDWNEAAERVGNAILAANPDWLIIVEGVGNNSWWGGNLQGVAANPVNLIVPNKVVYSVHEYCQDVFNHTWLIDETFPNNLRGVWNDNFGYIVKQDIAPVYVGEYGTAFRYPGDYTWLRHWVAYINGEYSEDGVNDLKDGEQGLSWTFWAINPGGDVGGVLEDDWITVNEAKMAFIRSALAPLLPTYDPIPTTQPSAPW